MIKRIVPVNFWSETLELYSHEDRLFHLYLLTNQYSSQLGIYRINKLYMMFELGHDLETIDNLLDRFENKYHLIAYNHETQEISILHSLEHSIIRGGKPVLDLLTKEFMKIKDAEIILRTYQTMLPFWESSKRKFDMQIERLFYSELADRHVNGFQQSQSQSETKPETYHNNNYNNNHNYIQTQNQNNKQTQNDNHNHNQISSNDSDNESVADSLDDIQEPTNWKNEINDDAKIILTHYQETIGEITYDRFRKLSYYLESMTHEVIVEAIGRSYKAGHPYKYCLTILKNWHQNGVQHLGDIMTHDEAFLDKFRFNKTTYPNSEAEITSNLLANTSVGQ